jgi:hypothetical protein
MSSVPRKQPGQAVCSSPKRVPLPLPSVRKAIWEAACELAVTYDTRNPAKVLAGRFRVSLRTVMLSLITEGMRHERTAKTLWCGIANVLAMARESARCVDDDLFRAA